MENTIAVNGVVLNESALVELKDWQADECLGLNHQINLIADVVCSLGLILPEVDVHQEDGIKKAICCLSESRDFFKLFITE
ncbi:hypothetical protein [Tenacibaculum maritimum]|uniref:hypothetical protein n=1 Tax=Tenacibaculum maritimum TaxID=107401 RepID=UPI0012E569F5|nr:hypothetical protein [Tenacibaculum maritimum]CAA0156465.1 hypothetical protein JIP4600_100029 [Tenacibaculum maritimum]CAA0169840.1 hypothetical protein TMFC_140016 [Tenacibaculum maritimum]CAA0238552.1 hypothetical protein TMP139_570018 [Tenacibaculum maritimum]